jgi:hypothetical protein
MNLALVSTTSLYFMPSIVRKLVNILSISTHKINMEEIEEKLEELDIDLKILVVKEFLKKQEMKEHLSDVENMYQKILTKNVEDIILLKMKIDHILSIHKQKWFSSYRSIHLEPLLYKLIVESRLLHQRYMYIQTIV